MEDVRKALAISIAARGVGACLTLLGLPIYLQYLGVEAYAVVGLFASIQVLVAFLDLGLSTTLTRRLASLSGRSQDLAQGRDTAWTFEIAYLVIAGIIAVLLAAAAPFVTSGWVKLQALSVDEVRWPLQIASLALACQWPSNLYSAGLAGLQRQVSLAVSVACFAALRLAVSIGFLQAAPTLESFFAAQLVASILQSLGMRWLMWRVLALKGHRPESRRGTLDGSWGFAGGMTAITITSILLTQMDKLILSYLLRLTDFGYYVIAGTLIGGLYIFITPVFSVIYPRISALWPTRDMWVISGLYHSSGQVMAVLVLPLAAVLAFFPAESIYVLTGDRLVSDQAAPILVFLVLGAALNGVMNIPYALQLAAGWTSLSVWINIASVILLAPATWWAATNYGAAGGAAAWAALNLVVFVLTPQLLHRRLLPDEKWRWYGQDVVLPAAVSAGVAGVLAILGQLDSDSRLVLTAQLGMCWMVTAIFTLASLGRLRSMVRQLIWR